MYGYEDDERYDLERAAWAGNGCTWCLATTHTEDSCPVKELAELDAKYHDGLPYGQNCPKCGIEHAAIWPTEGWDE